MKDFHGLHKKTINIFFLVTTLLLHTILGLTSFDGKVDFDFNSEKVTIKLKPSQKVRDIGKKFSKHKPKEFVPSKKQSGADFFKKFAIAKEQGAKKKPEIKEEVKKKSVKRSKKSKAIKKVNYVQRQIMQEAVKQKRDENPLLNDMNYNVKFIPPKGISPDELNEFEKVFYSFFKRIALQYINSVNSTVMSAIDDKPYLRGKLRKHDAAVLTARIVYDENGNAEKVTILKSSYDDDVHEVFEKALLKMNKIPNVSSALRGEDGKYTAFFQLGINQKSRN
ncbi:MAG: hypothetical protein BM556_02765 [Bacteriovorax sp. MedPE-SWde]|nr:MAG: hypothetical protein BM556_02765 [Bacteriovorax sp. MedPE-SWde]